MPSDRNWNVRGHNPGAFKRDHTMQQSTSLYTQRLDALSNFMHTMELDGIALNPGPSLFYFTGLKFHLSERPVLFLYLAGREPAFILPGLEQEKLNALSFPADSYTYPENPAQWSVVFREAVNRTGLDRKRIGIEPTHMRLLEYNLLKGAAAGASYGDATQVVATLRAQKTKEELKYIRTALQIAEQALQLTLPHIRVGMTEIDVAHQLLGSLYACGSEPQLPFMPIVAAGPNSSNPHAVAGARPLEKGDVLLIDWGASHKGYVSDLTRVFSMGSPTAQLLELHAAVLSANAAARMAGRADEPCSRIDFAARSSLKKQGLDNLFIHRTGHGLGLECHEPPYIHADNALPLLPGMVYTTEPGVYLPGKMGVRIEDMVHLSEDGPQTLSTLSREIQIVE